MKAQAAQYAPQGSGLSRSARRNRNRRARAKQQASGITQLVTLPKNMTKAFTTNYSRAAVREQVQSVSENHAAALHSLQFFDYMMQPEEVPPMRVPDGHAGVTAVFKSPFVVTLPYSGVWNPSLAGTVAPVDEGGNPMDGYSEVILSPGSTNCIYHTLGDAATIWSDSDGDGVFVACLASHPALIDFINNRSYLAHGIRAVNADSTDVAVLPKRDSLNRPFYELSVVPEDPDAGFELTFRFDNVVSTQPSIATCFVQVIYLDDSRDTIEEPMQSDILVKILVPVGASSGTSTIKAFSVAVSDLDTASHWTFALEQLNAGGQDVVISIPARSATAFAVKSAPELNRLNETLAERQAALSGLITYVGSTLQDGGQVAAARLGLGLSPIGAPQGDVFTYLASLPFYNDDFALREGIYSWWLPDSVQEHFYRPYRKPRTDRLEEDSLLHFAMRRDNPNQDVRLKSIHGIEVITRSRLYSSKPSPTNPSYEVMISAMKQAPAVTINSKHKGILSRAWGFIKGWVSKPTNWLKLLKFGGDAVSVVSPQIGGRMLRGAKILQDVVG